jgi:hypothetical protein
MQDVDITFGALGATRQLVTNPIPEQRLREEATARAALERELRRPVTAVAYPDGEQGEAFWRAMRACGYETGLSWRPAFSRLDDDPKDLPRIAVTGTDNVRALAKKLDWHLSHALQ